MTRNRFSSQLQFVENLLPLSQQSAYEDVSSIDLHNLDYNWTTNA